MYELLSTDSFENLVQKFSLKFFKLNNLFLSTDGCSPNQWHTHDFIGDCPSMQRGVFPILNLGINSFIHLFLMIPFNLDHNSSIYNTIYKKIPKYLNCTLFPLVRLLCIFPKDNTWKSLSGLSETENFVALKNMALAQKSSRPVNYTLNFQTITFGWHWDILTDLFICLYVYMHACL